MDIQRYQRKPIIVEAVRVTNENFTEVAHWCQGAITAPHGWTLDTLPSIKDKHIKVRVINPQRVRQTKAFVGDWVLYSEYSGYKVYTNGAFENAFFPADARSVEEAVRDLEAKLTPKQRQVQIDKNGTNLKDEIDPEGLRNEQVPDGTYGGARPAS